MKRAFYRFTLLIGMILGVVACQMETDFVVDASTKNEGTTITITTDGEIENETEETRTQLNRAGNKITWNTDDAIKVIRHVKTYTESWFYGRVERDEYSEVTSSGTSLSSDNTIATFTASFDALEDSPCSDFSYVSVSPATCYSSYDKNKDNINTIYVNLPTSQTSTSVTYDAGADLLVGKPTSTTSEQESFSMRFKRMVSIGKMKLTGLESNEKLKKVVFEAITTKHLVGDGTVDMTTGTLEYHPGGSLNSKLTINYKTAISATTSVYFCCYPTTFLAGEKFKVTVTCESGNVYEREVTIPAGKSLQLIDGNVSSFTVTNLTKAESQVVKTYNVGDVYNENGVRGVVYATNVTMSGKTWNYIMSMDQAYLPWATENTNNNCIGQNGLYNSQDMLRFALDPANYPAVQWCFGHGNGWFLPSSYELNLMWDAVSGGTHDFNNETVAKFNAKLDDDIEEDFYWSSNEISIDQAEMVAFMYDSVICLESKKASNGSVRAVYKFEVK